MKKLIWPLLALLAIWGASCSSDDNGTNGGDGDSTTVVRLVADNQAVKPSMTNANDPVWFTVDSAEVEIGGTAVYGINPNLGKQDVTLRAIKASDTLYLWAKWHDATANIWGGYIRKSPLEYNWDSATFTYDDQFFVLLDKDNDGVLTGPMDVWNWLSTKTAPGFMAQDENWDGLTHSLDAAQPNMYVYRRNWLNFEQKPKWMHTDSSEYTAPVLYLEDTTEIDILMDWPTGFKLPGYATDSTIHSSPDRGLSSLHDVTSISKYDSTGADQTNYTWTVVFARALNTTHVDDVNLAGLDSIQVRIEATHNGSDDHSGSAPFYIILNP